jgi:ABC-type uncharacterized transport system permease subunit
VLEPRPHRSPWLALAVPVISVIVALILAAVLFEATGHPAEATYRKFLGGAFGSESAWTSTLAFATPLLFTGLAAGIAFRMRLYNIGTEGQLYIGAVFASGVGLALAGRPALLVVPLMCVAGSIGGVLWAMIPAGLRSLIGVSEIITSFMLIYVAGYILDYLIIGSNSYWRDPSQPAFPTPKSLDSTTAAWPAWGSGVVVPFGAVLGVVLAVGLGLLYRYTKFGMAMSVQGDSEKAARYAGYRTRTLIFAVICLSGALAGLGGASEVGDFSHQLDATGLQQAAFGFNGIAVAALARYNPWATCLTAVLMGGIQSAGFNLQGADFSSGLVGVLNGLILFAVLGGEVFIRNRVVWPWRRQWA